jgi:hypothetical protein
VPALCQLIGVLNVGDRPIQVYLTEHGLLFSVVLLLSFLLDHLALLGWHWLLHVRLVLGLLLVNDDGIGVVLDGLIVPAQLELGVGLAEIVLDHVVIAVLQGLPDVFQGRLVLLQLVVEGRDEIVDETVLLIRDKAVPEKLLRRQQDLLVIILGLLVILLG